MAERADNCQCSSSVWTLGGGRNRRLDFTRFGNIQSVMGFTLSTDIGFVGIAVGWGLNGSRWADAWAVLCGLSTLPVSAVVTVMIRFPSWPTAPPLVHLDRV